MISGKDKGKQGTVSSLLSDGKCYVSGIKIVKKHRGSFLCDGVGLGKTFIGLMLIERLIQYDRKRVALFVPKSIRKTWERELKKFSTGLLGLLIFPMKDYVWLQIKIHEQFFLR